MTSTLSAKEQQISKIFSGDYVFTIPGYQRPYAWGTDQAQELLDDLLAYMNAREVKLEEIAPYFLGSIVLIKKESSPEAIVVDGQQRLTTLTLLLSAVRSLTTDVSVRQSISKRVYEQGDVVTATEDHFRLSLRERDRQFFRDFVQKENGIEKLAGLNEKLSDSQFRLRENAKLFLERLAGLDQKSLVRLVQFIANRCYLVTVATPDLDSAYRIFGVLNSRGLDLSATDILKAEIIGAIDPTKRDVYTEKWEDLEDDLGRDAFGELFSHIRMVYRKAKPKGTVLREFREHVGPKDSVAFVDGVLAPMAQAFREIADADFSSQKHAEAINRTLEWLNRIEFKDWLPPALAFFSRHRNDPASILKFLVDLERLAYSMLVRRTGVNERIERFSALTLEIESGSDLQSGATSLQLNPIEQYATFSALSGSLYDTHSARALSVILLRLDGLLSGGGATYEHDIVTVEHVMPQTPKADSQWQMWIPSPTDRLHWVHRLGNLALLTRKKNSAANNYDFDRKKAFYFTKGGVSPFVLTTQVLQNAEWTVSTMQARQEELLGALEKHWRLEGRQSPQTAKLVELQAAEGDEPQFVLTSVLHDLQAFARESGDDLVVVAGSRAKMTWTGADHPYRGLREELIAAGRLKPGDGEFLVFAENVAFRKPSAASAVILGRPDNGRASWIHSGTGLTYGEWRGDQVEGEPTTAEVSVSADERGDLLYRFWQQFIDLSKRTTTLFAGRNPTRDQWLAAGIGRSGFSINVALAQDYSRVSLFLRVPGDKDGKLTDIAFQQLHSRKTEIEAAFGGPLVWEPLPDRLGARICAPVQGGWRSPQNEWPALQSAAIRLATNLAEAVRVPVQDIRV